MLPLSLRYNGACRQAADVSLRAGGGNAIMAAGFSAMPLLAEGKKMQYLDSALLPNNVYLVTSSNCRAQC